MMCSATRSSLCDPGKRKPRGLFSLFIMLPMPRASLVRVRCGPFQVRVRYRVAMRVVRRVPERLVDPRFELLGDHVLEPVGLGVDVVDVEAERAREIELEQAVMSDD